MCLCLFEEKCVMSKNENKSDTCGLKLERIERFFYFLCKISHLECLYVLNVVLFLWLPWCHYKLDM